MIIQPVMGQPDLAQKRHQVAARAAHTEAPPGLRTTQAGQFGRAAFLAAGQRDDEPPFAIGTERVRENDGLLIVPYSSAQYLVSRDGREQVLDCWPTLVGLERCDVGFTTWEELHLRRKPSNRRGCGYPLAQVRDSLYGSRPAEVWDTYVSGR
ncbi:hypothetical protein [Streptomyces collinus]|uniref:hypothetical protein n=1 Tax=Streptomyces collinus TaxID=42684 RepID=UPI003818945F